MSEESLEEVSILLATAVCDHSRSMFRWCSPSPGSPEARLSQPYPLRGPQAQCLLPGVHAWSGLGASPQTQSRPGWFKGQQGPWS